jgi:hypothetical protein
MDFQRLTNNTPHCHTRVQRGIRILEDNLHLTTQSPHSTLVQVGDVLPLEIDRTVRRFNEPQDRAPSSRFSTTTFPYETQGFPFLQGKVDVINGVDIPDRFREHSPLDWEMLLQMLHFKQRCLSHAVFLLQDGRLLLYPLEFLMIQPAGRIMLRSDLIERRLFFFAYGHDFWTA